MVRVCGDDQIKIAREDLMSASKVDMSVFYDSPGCSYMITISEDGLITF